MQKGFRQICTKLTVLEHAVLLGGRTVRCGTKLRHVGTELNAARSIAGHLSRLEDLAQQEGYLTRIWRSNCFTSALEHLGITHCQSMSPEQKSR